MSKTAILITFFVPCFFFMLRCLRSFAVADWIVANKNGNVTIVNESPDIIAITYKDDSGKTRYWYVIDAIFSVKYWNLWSIRQWSKFIDKGGMYERY